MGGAPALDGGRQEGVAEPEGGGDEVRGHRGVDGGVVAVEIALEGEEEGEGR